MQLFLDLPELTPPAVGATPPNAGHRVYCNRSLRLDHIDVVGFDMDYTLARYRQEEMDRQTIAAAIPKMLERGWPKSFREMPIALDYAIRGLMIDGRLGNILKMDRYRYVKEACHGTRRLDLEERRRVYHSKRLRRGRRYHPIDTLYGLSEVSLFAAAVDHLNTLGESANYERLFEDIRASVDASHQDGTILDPVLAALPQFIEPAPALGRTLHKLRSAGKRLFLLTNSGPEYTEQVMSYLLDDQLPAYPKWHKYFDVAIAFSKKPRYFTAEAPLEYVEPGGPRKPAKKLELGRDGTYVGGHVQQLIDVFDVNTQQILYVGDHIYGDMLRPKKDGAFRTLMVLQELEHEIGVARDAMDELARLDTMREQRERLFDALREAQTRHKQLERVGTGVEAGPENDAMRHRTRRTIDKVRARLREVESEHHALEDAIDARYHPYWGPLFKAGSELSAFGHQVEDFACAYTSRVSNLSLYSPLHYFVSPQHRMAHER